MEGWENTSSPDRGFGAHHVGNAQTHLPKVGRRRGDNGHGIDPNFQYRNASKCFALVRSRLQSVVRR